MTQKQVKTTTLSEILDSWRYKPWLMLGIGFYFAFSLSVVVNCPQLIIDKDPSYSILFVRVAFSATVSLGLIVIMFLIHRFDVLNSGKWVIVFSASSTSLGTVLLILALNFVDSIELMITATSLVGLGNAVLLLSWGAFVSKIKYQSTCWTRHFFMSFRRCGVCNYSHIALAGIFHRNRLPPHCLSRHSYILYG